jgi:hypothetical protein
MRRRRRTRRARFGGGSTGAWHVAVVACATAAAFGGVASVMLPAHHPSRSAADCGLVTCTAALPSPAAPPAVVPVARSSGPSHPPRHRRRHHAARAAPPPAAVPAPPPRPQAHRPRPARPRVTVSYSLIRSWDGGFLGHFTITNHGNEPISRWVVNATLPGDHVESAWDADFQTDGDTLTLTPASYDPAIGPGDSQSAYFTAAGSTTRPTASSVSGS